MKPTGPFDGGCTCGAVRYRMTRSRPHAVEQRQGPEDLALRRDIHIFTASKQPWVVIPPGMPAVEEYYKSADYWPAESLERRKALVKA